MIAKEYAMDLSDLLSYQGGDIIRVPRLANRTATTRTLTTLSQVTPVGASETQFSMNVQTWKVDPEAISFAVPAQTKLFLLSNFEHKLTESVMRAFDSDILAGYSSFTATALGTDDGVTAAGVDDVFDGLKTLDLASVPKTDRAIILGPKTYWRFIKSNVITSRDFGTNLGKESGSIPNMAGVPVFMTQNIPNTANGSEVNMVVHKEAFAYAIAQPIKVDHERSVPYLSDVYVSNMIYGAGCYRTEAGVAIYGS